jgi:oxygen-independent coproporphyrinogen-3 oxidase
MNKVSSLYVHYPFCRHLCNYCDFYKTTAPDGIELGPFHSYLVRALASHQKMMHANDVSWSPLETLYIGGGTPSLWDHHGAQFFTGLLNAAGIRLLPDCEFTMEINPGTLTQQFLDAWQALGLNRYSVGIQSLDERFIKILDRAHSLEESHETLNQLKGTNFSIDFMTGLPDSKILNRSIKDELRRAIDYGPSHFSVYILTTKENYKHQAILPDDSYIADEYLEVCDLLHQNGYRQYEVSNFSQVGKESKHNLKYWQGKSVAAIGPSATGLLRFNDHQALRYKWKTQSPEVQLEELSQKELQLEDLYLRMRLAEPMDYKLYIPNQDWPAMEQLVAKWSGDDLVERNEQGYFWLTAKGMLRQDGLMNDVFMQARGH